MHKVEHVLVVYKGICRDFDQNHLSVLEENIGMTQLKYLRGKKMVKLGKTFIFSFDKFLNIFFCSIAEQITAHFH